MSSVNWSNVTTANDLLATANTNTGGTFWTAMLVLIMIVLFMSLLVVSGAEAALLVTLFIGMILGTALLYLGLISGVTMGVIVGLLLFVIIYLMWSSRQNQF